MKKLSISIPNPCHENWNEMTPESKGRHCGSCQKTVIDFSVMSDRQLVDYFKKPPSFMCGRFMPDQLDRVIEAPPKRLPWLRYMMTIAIPAFLLSCKLGARQATQGKMISTEERIIGDTIANIVPPPPAPGMILITPIDTVKGQIINTKHFKDTPIKRCRIQPAKNDSERFSVVPFNPNPIIADTNIRKPVADDMQGLQGIAGSISFRPISSSKKEAGRSLASEKNVAKASSFLIYPNPVQTSASINIEWKTMEKGDYEVTILNNAGQTLQRENIVIDSESNKATISLRSIVSGVYFIRLTNKKTGKAFTEKIIVQ